MSKEKKKKEVSCLAITFFYDYLRSHDIPFSRLEDGLTFSPMHLRDKLKWIDFKTFLEIERRIQGIFPDDPELFFNIGQTYAQTGGFGFLRFVGRLIPVVQLFLRFPIFVERFLFPIVTVNVNRISRTYLQARYVFNAGYDASDAFWSTTRGILTAVPVKLGSVPAQVEVSKISEREAIFHIKLRNEWLGVIDFIKRVFGKIKFTLSLRKKSLIETAVELENTNLLLQEKVEALEQTQKELDKKVKDLSILNTLTKTSTSELDLSLMLSSAASVIFKELDNTPTVVLIADGEPPGLVVGARAGIASTQMGSFHELSNPTDPLTVEIATHSDKTMFRIPGADPFFTLFPMRNRQKLIGALVIQAGQTHHESNLFESMASQLAVAIDNAMSYRTIKDLTDNLELKVKERTAELEVATGKLEDMVSLLEAADKAKDDFFTNVSHEIRTPLTLLMSPLDEIERALVRAGMSDRLEELGYVRRNAQQLLLLVNEILDFSKLDQGQMPLNIKRIEFTELLDDLLVNLEPLAQRNKIRLIWDTQAQPVKIAADPLLLRRVLMNLIVNAIKYCDEGDSVAVSFSQSGESIRIQIADTGPGISKDQQAKIFERFQRAVDSKGRMVEGSGIGLAMVKEIVELHNGSIELSSDVGKGSTFKVTFPITQRSSETEMIGIESPSIPPQGALDYLIEHLRDAPVVSSKTKPPVDVAGRFTHKVLVIEDNQEMQGFLVKLLSQSYTVLAADDGQKGLEMAHKELPDVIVSDVMMPHLSGHEMCKALKEDPITRNIPIILLTAQHSPKAAIEGFNAGADDFVVKPFSPQELLARVEAQVRIRTLTMSLIRAEKQAAIGIMSAGIAHEVLNPINAVINAVQPLRETIDSMASSGSSQNEQKVCEALLGAIEESGNRINEIVNALLTFARPKDSNLVVKEARIRPGIESAMSILAFRLNDKVKIHRDYKHDDPVLCYPELLNQAIMNLITNALDALSKEGGNVWVSTEQNDGYFIIRVKNDGPGIAPELHEQIFTPFFTTKPPGCGTGLGLAITREIASIHNGEIGLSSSNEQGTEFFISIPLNRGYQIS